MTDLAEAYHHTLKDEERLQLLIREISVQEAKVDKLERIEREARSNATEARNDLIKLRRDYGKLHAAFVKSWDSNDQELCIGKGPWAAK